MNRVEQYLSQLDDEELDTVREELMTSLHESTPSERAVQNGVYTFEEDSVVGAISYVLSEQAKRQA